MDLLDRLRAYPFLTEDTLSSIRTAIREGRLTSSQEEAILTIAAKAAKELAKQEVEILAIASRTYALVLHEADQALRTLHKTKEEADRNEEEAVISSLEHLL